MILVNLVTFGSLKKLCIYASTNAKFPNIKSLNFSHSIHTQINVTLVCYKRFIMTTFG